MNEHNLLKITGQAIQDYHMIANGDTIWIALSGAPKSLCALIFLFKRLAFVPISYTLRPLHILLPEEDATTVCAWYTMLQSIVPLPDLSLVPFPDSLLVLYQRNPRNAILRALLATLSSSPPASKLVLGDNLEDIVLSGLTALAYHKRFSLPLPHCPMTKYPIHIIRPLAYLTDKRLLTYCESRQLPLLRPSHPPGPGKKKVHILLEEFRAIVPDALQHIFAAFRKPKKEYFLE